MLAPGSLQNGNCRFSALASRSNRLLQENLLNSGIELKTRRDQQLGANGSVMQAENELRKHQFIFQIAKVAKICLVLQTLHEISRALADVLQH